MCSFLTLRLSADICNTIEDEKGFVKYLFTVEYCQWEVLKRPGVITATFNAPCAHACRVVAGIIGDNFVSLQPKF